MDPKGNVFINRDSDICFSRQIRRFRLVVMTVNATYLKAYTRGNFAVSDDTGTIETLSADEFALFLAIADTIVASDITGLTVDSTVSDELTCLQILDRITNAEGKADLTGEKNGTDSSYTRGAGESGWLIKYDSILSKIKTGAIPRLIATEHTDSDIMDTGLLI